MKIIRILLLLILLISSFTRIAAKTIPLQINGKVIDAKTKEPVRDVNVFLKGTFRGTATDPQGRFNLDRLTPNHYTIIAHHIGYDLYSENIALFDSSYMKITIALKSKVIEGQRVEVVADKEKSWKHNIKIFQREFIGTSFNAKKCKLLNPEVVHFKTDDNRLHAFADSILRVENLSLGYRLHIVLDKFICIDSELSYYRIYPQFYRIEPPNTSVMKKWKKNREKTYTGSIKHFLASVASGEIYNEKFSWYHTTEKNVVFKEQLLTRLPQINLNISHFPAQHMVGLSFPNYLLITYGDNYQLYDWSFIELREPLAMLDSYGNLHTPEAIFRAGKWHKARIADLLPANYKPQTQE